MTETLDMELCHKLSKKIEFILKNYYSGEISKSMLDTRLELEELVYYLVRKYNGKIDREDGSRIGLVALIFSKNLKRHTSKKTREYMKQINQITLPSLHFNSQAGNINDDQDELIERLVKFSMIFNTNLDMTLVRRKLYY